jgi:hypothetical protein
MASDFEVGVATITKCYSRLEQLRYQKSEEDKQRYFVEACALLPHHRAAVLFYKSTIHPDLVDRSYTRMRDYVITHVHQIISASAGFASGALLGWNAATADHRTSPNNSSGNPEHYYSQEDQAYPQQPTA